ncbi:beta-lactamase family protein [Candidatus Poribacteria bacterium]|nr:beta-lactamase family protein [Candidatus Poribacteria bacterium]
MILRAGTPEEAGMSAQRVSHAANLAKSWVTEGHHPALVVLVARRGVMVLHEAFGNLTPESDSSAIELDSIFSMASLSKPITATAAMMLVEDGQLSLNRPVAEYISEFIGDGKDKVMVHHLLTHTSGFRTEDIEEHAKKRKGTIEILPSDKTQHSLINEYLLLRYDAPLSETPGTLMYYDDYNYSLVGEIVRRVSGKSLTDFATERIFKPLGMRDTYYIVPESVRHRIVGRPDDAPFAANDTQESQKTPWPAWGVFSTAMDMVVFGQMFLNEGSYEGQRLLSHATVSAMTRNQIPGIGARYLDESYPEAGWSYGWNIQGDKKSHGSLLSPKTFSHGGGGGVLLWVDPAYEVVGAYFSVSLRSIPQHYYHSDLFIDAVTAAVVDV